MVRKVPIHVQGTTSPSNHIATRYPRHFLTFHFCQDLPAEDSKSIVEIAKEILDKEASSFPQWIRLGPTGKTSLRVSSVEDVKMILRHIALPRAMDEFNQFLQSQEPNTATSSSRSTDISVQLQHPSPSVLTTRQGPAIDEYFSSLANSDAATGLKITFAPNTSTHSCL